LDGWNYRVKSVSHPTEPVNKLAILVGELLGKLCPAFHRISLMLKL
jgi:hypothetical protein